MARFEEYPDSLALDDLSKRSLAAVQESRRLIRDLHRTRETMIEIVAQRAVLARGTKLMRQQAETNLIGMARRARLAALGRSSEEPEQ